ncbi:MAG: type II toxin-antitoxin system RelE/ParE family toxin [Burkholderiales bacterium]
MPLVRFSERALANLERLFEFSADRDPSAATQAGARIIDATAILANHPLVGRPVEGELRELVISYGKSGYVALYRFLPREDRVGILAIRHQREAGFK